MKRLTTWGVAGAAPFVVFLFAGIAGAVQSASVVLGVVLAVIAAVVALVGHLAVALLVRQSLRAEEVADAAVVYINGLRGNGDPPITDLLLAVNSYKAVKR